MIAKRKAEIRSNHRNRTAHWNNEKRCKGMSVETQRSSSVGDDAEEELSKTEQGKLLLSILKKDLKTFSDLLNNGDVDLHYWYKSLHTSCIQYICKHDGYIQFLKKVGPNLNTVHPEPIHLASRYANKEALLTLLGHKITKINKVDNDGRTALHHASKGYCELANDIESKKKYIECIQTLMGRKDFNINNTNYKGFTAIHEAANYGDERLIQAMIQFRKHDLDIDSHRSGGKTAREVIEERFPRIKLQLPEGGPKDIKTQIQNRLLKSLEERDINKFVTILSTVTASGNSTVDPNFWYSKYQSTCLEMAIKQQDCVEFVKALLQAKADPNFINPDTDQAPIHLAIDLHNTKALQELLSVNPPIDINVQNVYGKTPLHMAVEKGYTDCIELILSKPRVDVNKRDSTRKTALYKAAERLDKSAVVEILKYMNDKDKPIVKMDERRISDTWTGLHIPKQVIQTLDNLPQQQSELFQYLSRGDSKNFRQKFTDKIDANSDNGRNTMLQCAVKRNMVEAVKLLLEKGADPNKASPGTPPFIIATKCKFHDIMELFLKLPKEKFEVNVTDVKGDTALHWAANNCELDHVVELLRHGADPNIKNLYNKSPFDGQNLEKLLDQSIKTHNYPLAENFKLEFNFSLLLSQRQFSDNSQRCEDADEHDGAEQALKVFFRDSDDEEEEEEEEGSQKNTASSDVKINITDDDTQHQKKKKFSRYTIHVSKVQNKEHVTGGNSPSPCRTVHSNSSPNLRNKENKSSQLKKDVKQEIPLLNTQATSVADGATVAIGNPINSTRQGSKSTEEETFVTEMDFLYEISKNHRDIVNHPIVRCFVHFKWNLMYIFHSVNIFATALLVIALNLQIFNIIDGLYMVAIFLSVLIIREFLQFGASFKRYKKDIGNVFDWSLIIVSILILCNVKFRGFMPLGILLSWLQLIYVCSRTSFLALKYEMLTRVAKNYIKYLLSYFLIIFAFVLCFHSMYIESKLHTTESQNTTQSNIFMQNVWLGFVQTTMMIMNNEYQMGIPQDSYFQNVIYTMIYLLFIFITMIVLLNLLTGLAVSDTKAIMDSSKQLRIRSQIEILYDIENILFKLCRFFTSICKCFRVCGAPNFVNMYFNYFLVFPNAPGKKFLTIYPNKNGEIWINDEEKKKWKMDKEILGETHYTISKQETSMENDDIKERIEKIETIVNQLQEISNNFEAVNLNVMLNEINERECEIKQMLQQILHTTKKSD